MATKKDAVSLRSLLPYLREHRRTLAVVAVLSLLGSGASLAQPLLTRAVLDGIGAEPAGRRTVALLVVVLAACRRCSTGCATTCCSAPPRAWC